MWSDLRYRVRAILRGRAMEQDLADELQFHRERSREAHRDEFANIELIKEECRDARGIGGVDRLRQDLRYAWRMLVRHSGFSLAVIATLGLGIGGATTMFGVVDGILLQPLAYPNAERVIQIGRSFGGVKVSATSASDYALLVTQSRSIEAVAISRGEAVDVRAGGTPMRVAAVTVSASYFSVLGITAARGQLFSPDHDKPGSAPVAVISNAFWQRQLNADAEVIGRSIIINGEPRTIVGVLPGRFRGPEALDQQNAEIWLPLGRLKLSPDPDDASLSTLALRAKNADPSTVTADLDRIGSGGRFWATALQSETVGDSGSGLWLLFAAVSVLLLIACTNVANLFLVRASDRTREIAVRTAMGAGSARIARQLVTETLLFGLTGGAVGTAIAYGGIGLVRAWAPEGMPRVNDLHVDVRVLAFAFVTATVAGLIFGIVPALQARRLDAAGILRRSATSITPTRPHFRLRGQLVVLQTALASALVVGAGLLANSVMHLVRVNPGFDARNVVWLDVTLPERAYPGAQPKLLFFEELTRRAQAAAGVTSASIVQGRPLGGGNAVSTVAPEGQLPAQGQQPPRVPYHVVSPGYFKTLSIDTIDGRDFTSDDNAAAPRVAIVSRAFAERFFPAARAVGKRFWMGRVSADAPLTEVIGVVEDVRQYGLAQAPVPIVYRALAQVPRGTATLMARHGDRSGAEILDTLRAEAWALDPSLPLDGGGTMETQVMRSIREPRFRAMALSAFGVMALVIASIGLYGTLAWLVRTRRRELGVRIALGADARHIRIVVFRRGLLLAGSGIAIGLTLAGAGGRWIASLVFGITPTDVPTFLSVTAVLLAVAFVTSWLPARLASRIDPVTLLRD